ncbi:TIGR03086 family metal-binding protein [Ornithinimicrobium murale]|uniref:TIGR03086 family metal-binding protein n=1 Tax=Ornithinimicrobium murale TaxID=1050153 RepID=UPI000E0CD261|nr:TIGR03086 family metal-binding protein [Ornithinimicrobium murale]
MSTVEPESAVDLRPAAELMATVVRGVRDDQLDGPTPCTDYTVGDLLDHVSGLSLAFAQAARKEASGPGPSADSSRLPPDWREVVPGRVLALAEAWRDPESWSGQTAAGGLEMDGATAGLVALDELVLHGWDLAVATGQPFDPDRASVEGAQAFAAQFSGPGTEQMRRGLFGTEVAAPADATRLETLLAMAGRDPRDPAFVTR